MGDLTLITYIGDEKEANMPEKGPPQPPATLQATTFHSLPRYFLVKILPLFYIHSLLASYPHDQ